MDSQPLPKDIPSAFISYSWDDETHKRWVIAFGARLRADGIELIVDEWATELGDQLPHFMERSIRDSDYVLIVCTPSYKERCDNRRGGVGYEGNIITGELLTSGNERKFLPILRHGEWRDAAPSWLAGKKCCDLRSDPYSESEYERLLGTLHRTLPAAPPVGPQPSSVVIQNLDDLSVTHQRTYADLVNAAVRTHQAAAQRMVLLKSRSAVNQSLLEKVESELEHFANRVFQLWQEVDLFSSALVAAAAKEVATQTVIIRMHSTAPALGSMLEQDFRVLVEDKIPRFREEVRRELAARRGVV